MIGLGLSSASASIYAQTDVTALNPSGRLLGIVSDLEPSRAGIPVLLRQYLKLGGKLLGLNVDPEFLDALDGLIVVDRAGPNLRR